MSQKIVTNYNFNASEGILTLPDYDTLKIEGIISIENLTKKEKFYPENDILIVGNTIDFVKSLVGYSNSDKFRIVYDDGASSGALEGSTAGGTSRPLLVDEDGKTFVRQGDLNDQYDSVTTSGKSAVFINLSTNGVNTDLFPSTDVSDYATIKVNISTIGSAGNFIQFAFSETGSSDWQVEQTVGAGGSYVFARKGRYFKATLTVSGGSTAANGQVSLFSEAISDISIGKINYPVTSHASMVGMQSSADTIVPLNSLAKAGDNASGNVPLATSLLGFNGTDAHRLRYANITKSVSTLATGDTAVWTPTSGKKYRLLGYQIYVTGNASIASGGEVTIKLRDGTASDLVSFTVYVPGTATTTLGQGWTSGFIPVGGTNGGIGLLGGATNRVLNVNLSAALTSGKVNVVAVGAEDF